MTIIKLDDGRYVMADECQYMLATECQYSPEYKMNFIKVKTFGNGYSNPAVEELINLDNVISFRRGSICLSVEDREHEIVWCDTVRERGIAIDCTLEHLIKLVADRSTGSR